MKTATELRIQVTERATEDDEFRALLLSDPKTAVEQELGVTVPDGINLMVHETGGGTVHLVLPPRAQLDDAQLASAAGGWGGYW